MQSSGERVRSAVTVWVLFIVLLAGMTWIAFIIAGLRDDVATERSARNALVQQVKGLGEKPVVGPAGPQGTNGKDGTNGVSGVNGADGSDGDDGNDGQPGAAGADGKPGRDGQPGAIGEKGATGERGETGATGPVGPTGPTGATGDPGPSCPTGYTVTEKVIEGEDTIICVKTKTLRGR